MANYGENIRLRREELGMSQVQLAELIGESKQTIWKYESGTVKNIPLPKVELIAKALHCSTEYITGWQTKKEPVIAVDDGQVGKYEEIRQIFDELTDENVGSLKDYALYLLQRQKSQDDQ